MGADFILFQEMQEEMAIWDRENRPTVEILFRSSTSDRSLSAHGHAVLWPLNKTNPASEEWEMESQAIHSAPIS